MRATSESRNDGEAPANTVLVQTEAEVETLEVADPDRTAYITQTTLSVDETGVIIEALKKKFSKITVRRPTTSATRPPTDRWRSRTSPANASWSW